MSAPAVEDRAGRRRASTAAAAGDRLPAPVKERRPALAALAVLLIVGGALASGLVVLRSGQRSDYLVLRTDVAAGERITASDLGTASIAGSGARAIPTSRRSVVVGEYATTRVYAGTLATWAMFAVKPAIPPGQVVVGAVLGDAQRPARDPVEGDVVAVYLVPRADASGTAAQFLTNAVVTSVGDPSGSSGLSVSLQIPRTQVQQVETAAALNQLAIIGLPTGTDPATGTSPSNAAQPSASTNQSSLNSQNSQLGQTTQPGATAQPSSGTPAQSGTASPGSN